MDFAFVGPLFSDGKTNDVPKSRKSSHNKHKSVRRRNRHKSHSIHFVSHASSQSSSNLGRMTNLKHIAAKYDNLYNTSYYINLIPKNDTWIHAPFRIPKTITPTMDNHNTILSSFKCPDHRHEYSLHIQQCLDLFNELRDNDCDENKQWELKQEQQNLKIYCHLQHDNLIKSRIILPFSTPIITGIILNIDKHQNKWDKQFEKQQFIKRHSMFTHLIHKQYQIFDKIEINFIYPLSDGSIIIGHKTTKHKSYPLSASSCRAESDICLWHIVPNFNAYNHETDYFNHDYLHSSIVTYYNHLNILNINGDSDNDIDIDQYLLNDAQNVLKLKHYIKSISHTLHRPGVLYIPPYPMLQIMGINGIYVGRNKRARSRGGAGDNESHSLSNHQIERRKQSFVYADDVKDNIGNKGYEGDALLFDRFNQKKSYTNNIGITGTIKLENNSLIFTRQDWMKGERFRLCDVEISQAMQDTIDENGNDHHSNPSGSSTDDEDFGDIYGIKRKRNIVLSFQNGASCITLATMAVSELLQHTHSCSAANWLKLDMKTPTGLRIFEHIDNGKTDNDYFIHRGCATINHPAQQIFDFLCDPLCRFSYDIMVNTVQLMEKLDDNTYILRLLHTNKQCFLKTERESIVVVRHRVMIPKQKFVIAAVSIEHPAYPTENGQRCKMRQKNGGNVRRQRSESISKGSSMCMNSGFIRTEIRASGWIIERDDKNKYQSRIQYIMNIDFGGNVPGSVKRNVAKKQPFAIYHLAKALKKKQQMRRY